MTMTSAVATSSQAVSPLLISAPSAAKAAAGRAAAAARAVSRAVATRRIRVPPSGPPSVTDLDRSFLCPRRRARRHEGSERAALGDREGCGAVAHSPTELEGPVGFEPTTRGLKVPCSAAELRARRRSVQEEPTAIGPLLAHVRVSAAPRSGPVVDLRVDQGREALSTDPGPEVRGGPAGHLAAGRLGRR